MDYYECEAVQDFLLHELNLLKTYKEYLEDHEEAGSQRMHLYQYHIMREHVHDMLDRIQQIKSSA